MLIGGNDVLLEVLVRLHREQHAHLHQYAAAVVCPEGLTLRQAADGLGVSYQRVAQLRDKGIAQRAVNPYDLSGYPMPGGKPRPMRRAISPDVVGDLKRMNADAKAYRRGDDPTKARRFYRLVERLHDEGISYRAIARTLGENQRVFSKRLARWGVTEGKHSQTLTAPASRERKNR